jgi:hypothetical protein
MRITKMTYSQFLKEIKEYDSDTFNASGLSKKRVRKLAQKCLDVFVNNYLDGVLLTNLLDGIMEEK